MLFKFHLSPYPATIWHLTVVQKCAAKVMKGLWLWESTFTNWTRPGLCAHAMLFPPSPLCIHFWNKLPLEIVNAIVSRCQPVIPTLKSDHIPHPLNQFISSVHWAPFGNTYPHELLLLLLKLIELAWVKSLVRPLRRYAPYRKESKWRIRSLPMVD